ncbi:hypothetical protein AVEN_109535-1 [Araneus ventricosus]|uniref:Gustatory receptor n=1 Tax=Araneus ventricosus TaxID=182803 RepID=A0A4Y2WJ16_ARAVE|nr:hypothetical protein AVEN_109535-1 [Araneus ventricosus]
MSLLFIKLRVLKALSSIYAFDNAHGKLMRSPLRKYAILACRSCVLIPVFIAVASIVIVFYNFDRSIKLMLDIQLFSESDSNFILAFAFGMHQTVFMFHFFMFPGLVMTLLSFVYLTYVKSFGRHLASIRFSLLQNFSKENVSRALVVFDMAKKIHLDIENAFSFIAFLSYVLSFCTILNLVCVIASNHLSAVEIVKHGYTISVFSWTVCWFAVLTICGSRLAETENFIKNMSQEIVSRNFLGKLEKNKELIHLYLFSSCTKVELRFTGWGIFDVDKKLFLTISGIMVTYGVLLATELQAETS